VTETFKVADLAKLVSTTTGAKIDHLPNPRLEADENDLVVDNHQFLALGLNPTTLSQGLVNEVQDIVTKYIHRVDKSKIPASSQWRSKGQASK
jgi:UDP-sulfoquinovose synthase